MGRYLLLPSDDPDDMGVINIDTSSSRTKHAQLHLPPLAFPSIVLISPTIDSTAPHAVFEVAIQLQAILNGEVPGSKEFQNFLECTSVSN